MLKRLETPKEFKNINAGASNRILEMYFAKKKKKEKRTKKQKRKMKIPRIRIATNNQSKTNFPVDHSMRLCPTVSV